MNLTKNNSTSISSGVRWWPAIFVLIVSILISYQTYATHAPSGTLLIDSVRSQLTLEESKALSEAQAKVEQLLPPKLLQALIKHRPKTGYRLFIETYEKHIAGHSNAKGEIQIQKNILQNEALLTSTLIHEWSHLYDYLGLHAANIQSFHEQCQSNRYSGDDTLNPNCDLYKNLSTTVSSTPEFLEVSGWFLSIYGKGQRTKQTSFSLRSLRQYEAVSPLEMFAVNMESFLLDSEFQCRKPTMFRFLAAHFSEQPLISKSHNCAKILHVMDTSFSDASKAFIAIDPSKIYQIHYMMASRGSGLSSSFGHTMIRLIVCAPERAALGPECLADLKHHLVLSFRAFVDTPEINNISGLMGKYPSRLFFIPMSQIIAEYNKNELRDLYSYPLELSRQEILQVLQRAVETHWTYNGQYYFMSNNCTIETMNMLRSALLRKDLLNEYVQTPFAMRDLLLRTTLINPNHPTDRKLANSKGYLFLSFQERYDQALRIIRSHSVTTIPETTNDWLDLNSIARRNIFVASMPADSQKKISFSAAYLLLENLAASRHTTSRQLYLTGLATAKNLDEGTDAILQAISSIENSLMGIKSQLVTPSHLFKASYGIPTPEEQDSMLTTILQVSETRRSNHIRLAELYEKLFKPEQTMELKIIHENIALFAHNLRR